MVRIDRKQEAIDVLNEVIERPEDPYERFSALRMKGQYLKTVPERRGEAKAALETALAMADADPHLRQFTVTYASVANQYAELAANEGDIAASLISNERLASAPEGTFQFGAVESSLHNNVGLWLRAGMTEQAVVAIDRLLERFPEYGQENGWGIDLRLQRAQLVDPTKSTEEYVRTLLDVWNSPSLHGPGSMIGVGMHLATAYRKRQQFDAAIALEQQIIIRADAMTAELQGSDDVNAERDRRELHDACQSSLNTLVTAGAYGHRDVAVMALTRLRNSAVNDSDRQEYARQLRDVEARR